jgi:hypothetical protein
MLPNQVYYIVERGRTEKSSSGKKNEPSLNYIQISEFPGSSTNDNIPEGKSGTLVCWTSETLFSFVKFASTKEVTHRDYLQPNAPEMA